MKRERPSSAPSTPPAGGPAASGGRLSIGALSRGTGIPVETLRTWEARYGFPTPERTPSGHRLYAASLVPRLRRIAEALARGHRASQAVPATDEELSELLDATPAHVVSPPDAPAPAPALVRDPDEEIDTLLQAVAAFDRDRLARLLLAGWARFGLVQFLDRLLGPMIRKVGDAWSVGALEVRHEHFVSERVGDLLRSLRLPYDDRATGPLVVCATLPDERHGLGLHMAALTLAAAGSRVLFLGTDIPVDQIVAIARDVDAGAVALSASSNGRPALVKRQLTTLRGGLPAGVRVVIGGDGAPAHVGGTDILTRFGDLERWAHALPSRRA